MLDMSSDYLSKFKSEYNRTIDIAKSLKEALVLFFNNQKNDEELLEIRYFFNHLDKAEVGTILQGYQFILPVPESLKPLFELAALFEHNAWRTQPPLVIECENILATEGDNPKVVFLQTAKLEKAINSETFEQRYIRSARNTLEKYLNFLSDKLVTLILSADDELAFKKSFKLNFPKEECIESPLLYNLRRDFVVSINYLSDKKNFFTNFYSSSSLADKYDVVLEYYSVCKAEDENAAEILKILYYEIIKTALVPFERKLFSLAKEGSNLQEVFDILDGWVLKAWRPYQNESKQLLTVLENRVRELKQSYLDWEKLIIVQNKSSFVPMYKLYSIKSLADPSENPKVELEKHLNRLKIN